MVFLLGDFFSTYKALIRIEKERERESDYVECMYYAVYFGFLIIARILQTVVHAEQTDLLIIIASF